MTLKRPPAAQDLESRLAASREWTAAPTQVQGVMPWDAGNPRVMIGFNLRLKEPLHMKLKFLAEHEPQVTMQKLCIEAIEAEVNRRLAKYVGGRNENS